MSSVGRRKRAAVCEGEGKELLDDRLRRKEGRRAFSSTLEKVSEEKELCNDEGGRG